METIGQQQTPSALECFLEAIEYSNNLELAALTKALREMTTAAADAPSLPSNMKVMLKQDVLLKGLKAVIKAISSRSTLPILKHILIVARPSQLIITGTNLQTSISVPIDAQVEREGAYTIPAKILLDCVQTFPTGGQITLEIQEPRVIVSCGRTFSLKEGRPAEDFPPLWQEMVVGKGAPIMLGSDRLRQAIKEVQYAAATDETRPVMNTVCVHLKQGIADFVATDSYRLAIETLPVPSSRWDGTLLVPAPSMSILADVLPPDVSVIIAWDSWTARILFQAGGIQVVSQLVEGTFPDYGTVLPKTHQTSFILKRKTLEQVLKAFKPIGGSSIEIVYSAAGITFKTTSEDRGDAMEQVEAIVEGDDGSVMFDQRFLGDVLKHIPSEACTFYLSGAHQPGVIIPTNRDDYTYVIMPKHIQ